MLNEASVRAVAASRLNDSFAQPLYDTYSFARIPATISTLLTGVEGQGLPRDTLGNLYGPYDVVVLCFIDALGWRFIERYAETFPFLRRFFDSGIVSQLTSQFPSTTAAHVTTIHTGLPVGTSGVFEWFYYEPRLDRVIAPLLFSYAGDKGRNTLKADGVTAGDLFPRATLYQELRRHGVASFVFQHREYAYSPYSKIVTDGATSLPYSTLPEALVNLSTHVSNQVGRAYYFLYYDSIDAVAHRYGPDSPQVDAEIRVFLLAMEHLLQRGLAAPRQQILFLMTADHGQVALNPATTFYLNQRLPDLLPLLATSRAGIPLVPAGSSRDMFLYIKHGLLDEAHALLTAALHGLAEVWRVDDLAARGCFGTTSATFLARAGDLVILPYAGESVWWYEQGRFEQLFHGSHGGLTRDEIETVLLAQVFDG